LTADPNDAKLLSSTEREQMSQPEMKIRPDGTKEWFLNGKYHREDGPAFERPNGEKFWYLHGNLHREDGPAIEYPDGEKCWFLKDEEVTWEQVFRQAKTPEIELRILSAALITS
jgi:hypothetical protein